MKKLTTSFYNRTNVFAIAKELLGKILVTKFKGVITSGMITETEAYNGVIDSASHAFNGRRTNRNEVMYADAGTGYVYICYGIHHLFNLVTNAKEIPHAILIRAIEPVEGVEVMLNRRKMKQLKHQLTAGPGALSKALGIKIEHNGINMQSDFVWIEDRGIKIPSTRILSTVRVGVEGAGRDAGLPYRYIIKDNPWVSKTPKKSIH